MNKLITLVIVGIILAVGFGLCFFQKSSFSEQEKGGYLDRYLERLYGKNDVDLEAFKKDYKLIEEKLKTIYGPGTMPEKSPYGHGDYQRNIYVGRRVRRYEIHVPSVYDKTKPMPVVLNFHGGGGRAAAGRLQSRMDTTADSAGFIVVYPDGTGKFRNRLLVWNAIICCGYAVENNVDDVGFVSALIDDLATFFNIDPKRVYATGISNGALMCYRLAGELPNKIAAIAPVAAVLDFELCKPKRPISIMHFHGKLDKNAPYDGGIGEFSMSRVNFKPVRSNIMKWVKYNKCIEIPVEKINEDNAIIETYQANDGTEVILVTIDKMGHGWPGGRQMLRKEIEGETDNTINANDVMWAFFKKHPM